MTDILEQLDVLQANTDAKTKVKIGKIKIELKKIIQAGTPYDLSGLSPKEIQQSQTTLPEVESLIQVMKKILLNNSDGRYITVKQKEIVAERQKANPGKKFTYTRLDAMERVFRNAGWKVEYDKPAYNENYDAYFTFTAK